jgi:hypothetical protein
MAPLLREPDARRRMAARGRATIAAFTWERVADRIERAIVGRLPGRIDG